MKRQRVKAIDFKAGKPTRWQAYDTFAFVVPDASQRRMTDEGFMIVPAFISRIGVQDYGARELGIEGTNRTIRLYRPPEEVFKPASYGTFERQTLTNDHPSTSDGVTASNYQSVTSGDVHDVAPAGDDINLGANLYIKAANTIEMVVTYDKNQLSCGYSFDLDMTPGVSPDGQAYDGIMRDIVGNHVAIVWQARGGPGLRVADNKGRKGHTMRTLVIDGISIDIEDNTQASIIEKMANDAKAKVTAADAAVVAAGTEAKTKIAAADAARVSAEAETTAAKAALAAGTAAAEAAKTAHDAKVAELEAKVMTDAQQDALVEEKTKVLADAKAIIGAAFDGKGKTVAAIRLEALEHVAKDAASYPGVMAVLGGAKPAEAKPEIAKLAFDAAVAVRAAGGTPNQRGANDAAARAFTQGASGQAATGAVRTIDYNARGAKTKTDSASA